MKKFSIKAPAKINLTLEILNKRDDGFHNIQTIMHTISLCDVLDFEVENASENKIELSGNNLEIPYDEKNLVYKACIEFLNYAKIENTEIKCFINKKIPVAAGLAGGSTDAAATLKVLNKIFKDPLTKKQLNEICAKLGSDLNFMLEGGCALCTSRGEIVEPISKFSSFVSLVKPKNLGISAKEAYQKCTQRGYKQGLNNTTKLKKLIEQNKFDKNLITNDLERALVEDYAILKFIKEKVPNAVMSGSGSTFFVLEKQLPYKFDENEFEVFEGFIFV